MTNKAWKGFRHIVTVIINLMVEHQKKAKPKGFVTGNLLKLITVGPIIYHGTAVGIVVLWD